MLIAYTRLLMVAVVMGSAFGVASAVESVVEKEAGTRAAPVVAQVHEDLRVANDARSRQGAELQAWHLEQERLATALDGVQAEIARVEQELAVAEAERITLRATQERHGSGAVPVAQQVLADAARTTRARLQEAAASAPPGLVSLPADDSIDAVVKAIELSNRAAGQVAVELAAGHRQDAPPDARTAVRLLRAGALAWWMTLDGSDGGTAEMVAGRLELSALADAAERSAIRRAIAMVEGRAAAELVVLPLAPFRAQVGAAP